MNINKSIKANNPFCKHCKEEHCEIEGVEHGGDDLCSLLRYYLKKKKEEKKEAKNPWHGIDTDKFLDEIRRGE